MLTKIRRFVKTIICHLKPVFESVFAFEALIAKQWVAAAHHRLFLSQWRLTPIPDYFDHHIDLFYEWLNSRNPLWLERGVFGNLPMVLNGDVLELACGDGFNTRNFYSLRARHIIAVDYNPKAIRTAMQKNSAPNIEYRLADIRTSMPEGKFDNLIWDAAIYLFTEKELEDILKSIKIRLKPEGVLVGYNFVGKKESNSNLQHKYVSESKEDILRIIAPYFKNIKVFETIYPSRHNLYFWASDGILPFDQAWENALVQKS